MIQKINNNYNITDNEHSLTAFINNHDKVNIDKVNADKY